MIITGVSSISGQQIIAAASNSAQYAARSNIATKDSDERDITATYQTTAGMTAYATVESLTAKQDAGDYLSATDSANFLLTSDSGNFYPMNENPAGYLTEHQSLADYQTIAGMTAYLTTGDSANFLTAVPAGTMNESAFGYDASDNITGYNGSAFKAGDEFPQSATDAIGYVTATSANIDSTIDNVSANSGAWGGSALPISAGPGIKVNIADNTLVFSNDETVLFETTDVYGAGVCNLSESLKNFEHIAVLPTRGYTGTPNPGGAGPWNYFDTDQIVGGTTEPFQAVCPYIMEYINWKISQYNPNADCTVLTWNRGFQKNMQDNGFFTADSFTACVGIQKVIGINRK